MQHFDYDDESGPDVIRKDICPECGGIGHGKECECTDEVAFMCGCCNTCGGDGFISLNVPTE